MHLSVEKTAVEMPAASALEPKGGPRPGIAAGAFRQWMMRQWTSAEPEPGSPVAQGKAAGIEGSGAADGAQKKPGDRSQKGSQENVAPAMAEPVSQGRAGREFAAARKNPLPAENPGKAEEKLQDASVRGQEKTVAAAPHRVAETASGRASVIQDPAGKATDCSRSQVTLSEVRQPERTAETETKIALPDASAMAPASPLAQPAPIGKEATPRKEPEPAGSAQKVSRKAADRPHGESYAVAGETTVKQALVPRAPEGAVQPLSAAAQISTAPGAAGVSASALPAHIAASTSPVQVSPGSRLAAAQPRSAQPEPARPEPAQPAAANNAARAVVHRSVAPVEEHAAVAAAVAPVPRAAASAPGYPGMPNPSHAMQQSSPTPVSIPLGAPPSGSAAHAHPGAAGAVFDHIDAGTAPQVLSRTPQRLDVGVRDAGLGWVEVRAHAAEGQIAATVSASSAAHPALAAQLPAMREYLAGQQVRVDTLTAQPFEAGAEGGRHQQGTRNPAGDTPATATEIADEGEAENFSWIDVRV